MTEIEHVNFMKAPPPKKKLKKYLYHKRNDFQLLLLEEKCALEYHYLKVFGSQKDFNKLT